MFNKKYRRRLVVAIILNFFQQFSGVNTVVSYSADIFKKVSHDQMQTLILSIVSGFVLVFGAVVGGVSSKWAGRKSILIVGEATCCLTLGLLGLVTLFDYSYPSMTFALIFELAFGFSLGPLYWLYTAEILPEQGVSICGVVNWINTMIILFLFPLCADVFGHSILFFAFAIFCLIGMFYCIYFLKETKGLAISEIE